MPSRAALDRDRVLAGQAIPDKRLGCDRRVDLNGTVATFVIGYSRAVRRSRLYMQPAAIFCLEIDAAWNRLVGSRVKHLPPKADSFLLTWFALPPELIESFELRFDVFP